MKGCEHIWVHLDAKVLLSHDVVIPFLDHIFHPLPEWITNQRVDDVGEVGPWKLDDLVSL